jgi:putative ABC transport system permease protein
MMDRARPPRVVTWLLLAFPRRFRDAYAADIAADFSDRLAVVRTSGRRAVFAFWARTAANVIAAGLAERRQSSFVSELPAPPGPHRRVLMIGWTQDLPYAWRRLRREPAYALFVVLTLALGIGANVAVFSVVNGVLLKPLPYAESNRLVAVWGRFLPESGFDFPQFPLSIPEFVDYRNENRTFASLGAWETNTVTIGGRGEEPERVGGAAITPSLFAVLRATPELGRLFGEADRLDGPAGAVILSHALWQRRFGGRKDIVGQSLVMNGTARTIVGVMPKSFAFPPDARIWAPLVINPANLGSRQSHGTDVIGRLADGVEFETAQREMDVLMRGWRERLPVIHTGHFLYLAPLLDDTVGTVRSILRVLLAATAFLLLIVCANVASLILARAERRARELAIRTALGSGRWRLVRLAAVESGILAAAGGLIGAAFAAVAVSWLRQAEGVALPRLSEIALDGRVWFFAAALSAVAACLLSVLPAARTTAGGVASLLRTDTRTIVGGGRLWIRRSLVGLEVALAVILLAGAALMVQSFVRMIRVDPGFRTDHVLLANVSPPRPAYADNARADAFFDEAIRRLSVLPGVTRATLSSNIPLVGDVGVWDFAIEGRQRPGPGQPAWNAAPAFVRAGFFEAIRMRLVRGRFFTPEDTAGRQPVAVITEAFARKFFAGEDPIGRRMRVADDRSQYSTIVGIAGDIRDQALDVDPRPIYFLPHAQTSATMNFVMRQVTLVLQADGDPAALPGSVRSVIRELDPMLPVYSTRTFDAAVASSVAQPRFTTLLLTVFAGFGLALGVLGVYGVLAFTVAQRTAEIGIRRALGAPAARLVRLMLVQGLAPVVTGIAAGTIIALWASRLLPELFGIEPTDTTTYVVVAVGVLAAATIASLAPTRRALRVSPLTALRDM